MQTFLPFSDFAQTAKCLDTRRLGKQIVEARQIYDIMFRPEVSKATVAQQHHPIVNIWRHWVELPLETLSGYIHILNAEWRDRTSNNHESAVAVSAAGSIFKLLIPLPYAFHFAHRCSLLAKDFEHYDIEFSHLPEHPAVINPLWYHHPTGRWYTGRLSAPRTLFMFSPYRDPTVEEWLADCKRRGLFDPRPRIVSK